MISNTNHDSQWRENREVVIIYPDIYHYRWEKHGKNPRFPRDLPGAPGRLPASLPVRSVRPTRMGPAPGTGEGEAMGNPMGKPWETYGFLLKSIGKPMVLLGWSNLFWFGFISFRLLEGGTNLEWYMGLTVFITRKFTNSMEDLRRFWNALKAKVI